MWTVILIILLVVLLVGGLPSWPHMQPYQLGWYPSGAMGVLLVLLLILLLARVL